MKGAGKTSLAEMWIHAFPAFAETVNDAPWQRALREEALACFAELGLPHTKLEAWRSTHLGVLERMMPPAPSGRTPDPESLLATGRAALAQHPLPEAIGSRAVFVDGHYCPALSSFESEASRVQFQPFNEPTESDQAISTRPPGFGELASPKQDAFTALNTAFAQGGALLNIAPNHFEKKPIHLMFVSSGSGELVCPRLLIRAGEGSRATVVMDFLSGAEESNHGKGLVNELSEIFVEENATLECIVIEREGIEGLHIGNLQTHQKRDSRLHLHTFSLGGGLVRNELAARLADTGAEVDMRGLYLGSGNQHMDNHTLVDHAMPHTTSRQIYKGVLGENARGVFRGLVHVRPDAQKINSSQSNMNLLLSDKARIDTRPQLEIHADDVKCSHGSTIGKLDAEALFYLRSRGLSEPDARVLLTQGFVAEICDALEGDSLRPFAQALVTDALASCTGNSAGAPE